jgi:hypothetical protein
MTKSFSHTETIKKDGEKQVIAVFSEGLKVGPLGSLFNAKTAIAGVRRPHEVAMTLDEINTKLASDVTGADAKELDRGRLAIVQQERYNETVLNRVSKAFKAAVTPVKMPAVAATPAL